MYTQQKSSTRRSSSRSTQVARCVPLVAALALALGKSASAASIVVDDASAQSVSGKCTLVDAVAALNLASAVNGCVGGDGNNDTIDLRGFTTPTTISLQQSVSGLKHALALANPVTIVGSVSGDGNPFVTIERSSNAGVPDFGLILSTSPLTIKGLILQNGLIQDGYCGGAILAGDKLVVSDSILRNNHAPTGAGGAISATSGTNVTHSIITGNSAAIAGGGIEADYYLNLSYATIIDNSVTDASAFGGGGVYSSGALKATRSTISRNTSSTAGGGVYSFEMFEMNSSTISDNVAQNGSGGGVYANAAGVSAVASTISGNSATLNGGGISASEADLTNSTLSGNRAGGDGGAIFAPSAMAAYSTLSANTARGNGGGIEFSSATANGSIVFGNVPDDLNSSQHAPLAGSFNLIGSAPWGAPADTLQCDPQLKALADNGGPTLTMALGNSSCALDAASTLPSVSTDQRGFARPSVPNSKADIGAFELGGARSSSSGDTIFGATFQ